LWNPPAHPTVELFNLHASVWWGALMTVIGAWYCYHFKPGQKKAG